MKTLYKLKLALSITFLCASLGFGQPTFNTTTSDLSGQNWGPLYIGGYTTPSGYQDADVVGNPVSGFEIEGFAVTETAGSLTIDIYATSYFQNIISGNGLLGTQMGDLFISVEGLSWTDSAATTGDYFGSNIETTWQYGISLGGAGAHLEPSGSGNLFKLDDPNAANSQYANQIKLSDDFGFAANSYRTKQEAQIDTAFTSDPIASGLLWTIVEDVDDTNRDILRFTLDNYANLLGFGPSQDVDLGFHWTMTCANDVIEFEYSTTTPVPEPGTIGLMAAAGMVGVLILRRRLKK